MKLTVISPFSWAHRNVEVQTFELGAIIETDDADLIDVSRLEGWTIDADAPHAPTRSAVAPKVKAVSASPENKAVPSPQRK